MSHLSSNYKYRVAVAIDNTASATTTQDATFTIPPDLAEFWTTVLSSGHDIRVTAADGITEVTWKRGSWTYASRVGTIELDGITTSANRMTLVWMYWGYASAIDGAGSFVAASPLTGYIDNSKPTGFKVPAVPQRKGATRPIVGVQKGASEETRIFFDFRDMLLPRRFPYQGSLKFEEILDIALAQVQLATVSQAGMIDVTKNRFRDGIVEMLVQAGTNGTTYTVICRVTTRRGTNYNNRVLEGRCLLTVKDVSEV